MTHGILRAALMAATLAGGSSIAAAEVRPATTSGSIAIANLEHQLARASDPASRIELLLAKSYFLGDYDALDEAVALVESLPADDDNLLLRARARSAAHRFGDALADLHAARRMGADERQIARQWASIQVATGRAADAIPQLEAEVASRPGYAAHGALAGAYAELGRYLEADREYRAALADLRTTSPLPYAWIHFARGLMWSEQAGDAQRGEAEYAQALAYLPGFVAANIHKAELESRRGDLMSALARIERIATTAKEPEALALLGELERSAGDRASASRNIDAAHQRYRFLLERHPLAFADHAAEFYLGPGANPEQAWYWARRNLTNRATPRAFAIAIGAAATGGYDVCELIGRMKSAFKEARLPLATRILWERLATSEAPDGCH